LVDGTVFYEIASQLSFLTGADNATPERFSLFWRNKSLTATKDDVTQEEAITQPMDMD